MRRRDKAGRKALKTQRHKTLTRRNVPKVKRHRGSSASQETVVRLARELDETREQLTATSELLKVISSSPGELEPVFKAILENATQICEARFGTFRSLRRQPLSQGCDPQSHTPVRDAAG